MNPDTTLKMIETHARELRAARHMRDVWIAQARHDGISIRRIAEAAGVSHMTVVNIAKRVTNG